MGKKEVTFLGKTAGRKTFGDYYKKIWMLLHFLKFASPFCSTFPAPFEMKVIKILVMA